MNHITIWSTYGRLAARITSLCCDRVLWSSLVIKLQNLSRPLPPAEINSSFQNPNVRSKPTKSTIHTIRTSNTQHSVFDGHEGGQHWARIDTFRLNVETRSASGANNASRSTSGAARLLMTPHGANSAAPVVWMLHRKDWTEAPRSSAPAPTCPWRWKHEWRWKQALFQDGSTRFPSGFVSKHVFCLFVTLTICLSIFSLKLKNDTFIIFDSAPKLSPNFS